MEHFGGGVGEEAEGEFVLGAEAAMRLGGVLAHAHNVVAGGGQLRIIIPEGTRLCRAAGGVVLGVEVDDGLAAAADKVLRTDRNAVLVHHFEVGHGVSDFEHGFCVFSKIALLINIAKRVL